METNLEINDNNLAIGLRYNLPITKSEMYTKDTFWDPFTHKNNEVFGILGKVKAEADAPQFRFNDFKMGYVEISLAYTLFQK